MLAHFILTRFNVPTKGREAEFRARKGWLARRFDLFETFCLPSIAGQTICDFRWIIYFDSETPSEYRTRIQAAQHIIPFIALFREEVPLDGVIADVRALLPEGCTRILTTRLDNDDALASDFAETLRRAADAAPDGTALNLPYGYAWRNGWVYAAEDQSGPFASVVESASAYQTIWARPHALLGELFVLRQIQAPPSWLQVVHGDNVTNRVKGRRRPSKVLQGRFTLKAYDEARDPSRLAIFIENLIRYPLRQLREAVVRGIKPFLKVVR